MKGTALTATVTAPPQTDRSVQLRIPGDVFRDVNPRTFSFPTVTLTAEDAGFGTVFTVTADIDGIGPLELLRTVDADNADVRSAVDAFNADPIDGWSTLLARFFTEQRRTNADRRAALDQDEAFLPNLEAGFLR